MEASLATMVEHGTSWVKVLSVDEAEELFPHLQAVLDRNPELWKPFLSTSDILGLISDEVYQVWIAGDKEIEMFAITEVSLSPRAKIVTVVWCGGWGVQAYIERFFNGVEHFSRLIEADFIYVNGRDAWRKLLRPLGFEFVQVSLRKVVESATETALNRDADDEAGTVPGTAGAGQCGDEPDSSGHAEHPGHAGSSGVRSGSNTKPGGDSR